MSYTKLINFNHLSDVKESYWQHLHWCLYSTYIFIIMIPIAIIHGLFPMLLANVPDNIMVNYLKTFKNRRVPTGQEKINSLHKKIF